MWKWYKKLSEIPYKQCHMTVTFQNKRAKDQANCFSWNSSCRFVALSSQQGRRALCCRPGGGPAARHAHLPGRAIGDLPAVFEWANCWAQNIVCLPQVLKKTLAHKLGKEPRIEELENDSLTCGLLQNFRMNYKESTKFMGIKKPQSYRAKWTKFNSRKRR